MGELDGDGGVVPITLNSVADIVVLTEFADIIVRRGALTGSSLEVSIIDGATDPEVQSSVIVSLTVDGENVPELQTQVRICIDVEDGTSERGCLAFFDEERGEWGCGDESGSNDPWIISLWGDFALILSTLGVGCCSFLTCAFLYVICRHRIATYDRELRSRELRRLRARRRLTQTDFDQFQYDLGCQMGEAVVILARPSEVFGDSYHAATCSLSRESISYLIRITLPRARCRRRVFSI